MHANGLAIYNIVWALVSSFAIGVVTLQTVFVYRSGYHVGVRDAFQLGAVAVTLALPM